MNAIQQRYLDASHQLTELIHKVNATEAALGLVPASQLDDPVPEEAFLHFVHLDAQIEAFYGADLARIEFEEAAEALFQWGKQHVLPRSLVVQDLMFLYEYRVEHGRHLEATNLKFQIIHLLLRLKV